MPSSDSTPLRIGLVSNSQPTIALVRESVAAAVPTAALTEGAADAMAMLADCSLVLIDATGDSAAAGETARRLRAGASRSAIAFLVNARDEGLATAGARVGALDQVEVKVLARGMADLIERVVAASGGSEEMVVAREELRRTQRLLAAGEIALGLQHAMNNPLTSVLAEAQLLEMEPLPPETATAVRRIIESTRRLVALVRKLDAVSAKKSG
jgi:signal transduction histidine kinase